MLPVNIMPIYQRGPHILKAFLCVFVPFTLETVMPYLLDLLGTFSQVISSLIICGDN